MQTYPQMLAFTEADLFWGILNAIDDPNPRLFDWYVYQFDSFWFEWVTQPYEMQGLL